MNANAGGPRLKLEPLWETEARAGPKLAARAELLQAAASAFMTGGYADTTLDQVAARTGMTKGQIYHYYRSKLDLYFDVVVGAFFILNEAVRPLADQVGADASSRLHDVAFKHTMVLTETFPFQKVALEAAQQRFQPRSTARQSRAMDRMLQFRSEYEEMMVRLIEEGRLAGQFDVASPAVAAKAVLGALNWLLVWYDPRLSPRDVDRERIAEQSASFVVAAMSTRALPQREYASMALHRSASLRLHQGTGAVVRSGPQAE